MSGESPGAGATPGRFAYADPPYPGRAKKYYGGELTYSGEVDHAALVEELMSADYSGWALSTSADALRDVLPLLPPFPMTRVCAWVKPIGVPGTTYGLHSAWEPLLVVAGRRRRPGKRDWLSAQPARGGLREDEVGLMGRKPLAFCAFMFEALGMLPGDELVDVFPGTGVVGAAWKELGRASPAPRGDASPGPEASLPAATTPEGFEALDGRYT